MLMRLALQELLLWALTTGLQHPAQVGNVLLRGGGRRCLVEVLCPLPRDAVAAAGAQRLTGIHHAIPHALVLPVIRLPNGVGLQAEAVERHDELRAKAHRTGSAHLLILLRPLSSFFCCLESCLELCQLWQELLKEPCSLRRGQQDLAHALISLRAERC